MTTQTVEVEETRTVTEEIDVCNDCHREVDEDGDTFENDDGVTLHFCSECLDKMSDEFTPSHIERAKEWFTNEWSYEYGVNTIEKEVKFSHKITKRFGQILSLGLLATFIFGFAGVGGGIILLSLFTQIAVAAGMLEFAAFSMGDARAVVEDANSKLLDEE